MLNVHVITGTDMLAVQKVVGNRINCAKNEYYTFVRGNVFQLKGALITEIL